MFSAPVLLGEAEAVLAQDHDDGQFQARPLPAKGADRIVAFGQEHGLPVTGHMLCWNQMTPPWMFEDAKHQPLSREKALENLRTNYPLLFDRKLRAKPAFDAVINVLSKSDFSHRF
jgi:GH35 family endo-1,4-beta-xylanase